MRLTIRAFVLLVLAAAFAAPALAQDPPPALEKPDKLAEIRPEVKRLEAAGAFEQALKLLRMIVPSTLDMAGRLEWDGRIADLSAKQLARYTDDRAKARQLEAGGKHADAIALLEKVPSYGSEKQAAEAREEQARLKASGEKAAADAAVRDAADKKKREADAEMDLKSAKKAVTAWLQDRKSLLCSTCKGEKKVVCTTCDGKGFIPVPVPVQRTPGGYIAPRQDDPCNKCQTTGKVRCSPSNCGGRGFSAYKLKAVLWECWSPAFREAIDGAVGSDKKFIDLMVARFNGEDAGDDATLGAVFGAIGHAIEPIRGYEKVETAILPDGTVKARYRIKLRQDERWEETRWQKFDEGGAGKWALAPPALPPKKS